MNTNQSGDQPEPTLLVGIEPQLAVSHYVSDEIEAWQLARAEDQE